IQTSLESTVLEKKWKVPYKNKTVRTYSLTLAIDVLSVLRGRWPYIVNEMKEQRSTGVLVVPIRDSDRR
ncbi:unnamed protein product, partial [Musa acuminata subsp. burmannicoides]